MLSVKDVTFWDSSILRSGMSGRLKVHIFKLSQMKGLDIWLQKTKPRFLRKLKSELNYTLSSECSYLQTGA